MSSYSNNSNFDSLLLQSMMGRLQLRPPYLNTNSFLSQSLEDFLLDTQSLENSSDDDIDDISKTPLANEESKLEKEIIRVILNGNIDTLKPNSGQAVTVGEHHICVGFHEDEDSEYRVWEWHGHIMLFDEENGYSPEYIYGNYFERLQQGMVRADREEKKVEVKEEEEEEEETEKKEEIGGNLGLRELIDGGDSISSRIVHRSMNVGTQR
ncbi:hypothetical protein GIB67_037551 [Kingdonia uniflora]|uniref:Uncharacterized protein n=1 Tax=Kingdonia uniflora TaxID=39325 RepID=A0A7J7NBG5_9MAGN|nr:hypothetical protein GIB67_037551 [Kingdonia uniflora]